MNSTTGDYNKSLCFSEKGFEKTKTDSVEQLNQKQKKIGDQAERKRN